jgi:hypothetical protein
LGLVIGGLELGKSSFVNFFPTSSALLLSLFFSLVKLDLSWTGADSLERYLPLSMSVPEKYLSSMLSPLLSEHQLYPPHTPLPPLLRPALGDQYYDIPILPPQTSIIHLPTAFVPVH